MICPKSEGGFTLMETVIVLGIISILASILVPTLTKYISDTRLRKAQKDTELIGAAIGQFYNDTGFMPVSSNYGGATTRNDVETLEGPSSATSPVGESAFDWFVEDEDSLEDQLITNNANYPTVGSNRWKGPYLSQLRPDPWGNRYIVNVKWIQPDNMDTQNTCFVLSAGPNGIIETRFDGLLLGKPLEGPGGDDIVCRIK